MYSDLQETDHFQKTSQNNPAEEHWGYFKIHTCEET